MTIPIPKFAIGDRVFGASFSPCTEVWETCPDCLGQRKWQCTLPNGETMSIPCNTCERGYQGSCGSVMRYGPKPAAMPLTIGSVRLDTEDKPHLVSYMCRETGVGSGSVWYESEVFATEADALARAEVRGREYAASENERFAKIESDKKKQSRRKPAPHETPDR